MTGFRVIRPIEVDFSELEQRAYEVLLAEVVRIPIAALPSITDKENWTKRLVLRLREGLAERAGAVKDDRPKGTTLLVDADPEQLRDLTAKLVAHGMRETTCRMCGCWLLTRGDDDRCPPCRGKAS